MILNRIIDTITTNSIHIETRETNKELLIRRRISEASTNKQELLRSLSLIHHLDSYTLSIEHDDSDQSTTLSSRDESCVDEFCNSLSLWSETSGIKGILTLRITKPSKHRIISVYSLEHFSRYISDGNIKETLEKIESITNSSYAIECLELDQTYKTDFFVFKPFSKTSSPTTNPEPISRVTQQKSREKICSIYGTNNLPLPKDFRFDKPFPLNGIREAFNKIELVLLLTCLADISKIDPKGALTLTLKGYSSINFEIQSLDQINTNKTQVYFEIFEWTYTDGNIIDKAGISRNLISIHLTDNDLLSLKEGCLESIKSNYAIYLKDNLKQYVEIKNKLSDQIQKTSEKATDVVKTITTYLRTSVFSLYSFVFSVFLIRTLSKSDNSPLFSTPAYTLFILFILISLLVMIYAISETNSETRRFKKNYESFRERYTDLITKEDLNRIFFHDRDYERELNYIKKSRDRTIKLWTSSLVFIFITVSYLKIAEL